ncbi:hypothetical protein CHS0354_040008 [Potamilus streckersoni]|uniref:Uncharacterized protein n=1 Tax=Potamilus streckersoni TaxID=2493646 RepID=A0AAE0STB0_9BIVA|nr:hypothetical protein CHS0354_040008 [Potamilus streckersoni]
MPTSTKILENVNIRQNNNSSNKNRSLLEPSRNCQSQSCDLTQHLTQTIVGHFLTSTKTRQVCAGLHPISTPTLMTSSPKLGDPKMTFQNHTRNCEPVLLDATNNQTMETKDGEPEEKVMHQNSEVTRKKTRDHFRDLYRDHYQHEIVQKDRTLGNIKGKNNTGYHRRSNEQTLSHNKKKKAD